MQDFGDIYIQMGYNRSYESPVEDEYHITSKVHGKHKSILEMLVFFDTDINPMRLQRIGLS